MNKTKEWQRYKVDRNLSKGAFSNTCTPFQYAFHYTHLENAYTAIKEGILHSRLVYDKSKLNKRRITVCWLSPNDWRGAGGFRYGNAGFKFDIGSLVKGKKLYWIEAVPYVIPALHILVTEQDHTPDFDEYNPETGDGPWWFDKTSKIHHFNSEYCLELLLESDLSLSLCAGVDIASHSSRWCSLHRTSPEQCEELGLSGQKAAGLLLARIAATGLDVNALGWTKTDRKGSLILADELIEGYSDLMTRLTHNLGTSGTIRSNTSSASAISKAILMMYSYRKHDEAKRLANLFSSKDALTESLQKTIATAFDIADPKRLTF